MRELVKNKVFKKCVFVVLVMQIIMMMSMVSLAAGDANYAERAVSWFLDNAFWIVIAVTIFGMITLQLKHATSAMLVTLVVGSIVAFLCKSPETISNIGAAIGEIITSGS